MLINQGWFTALYTQHLLDSQSFEFEICIFPREAIPLQNYINIDLDILCPSYIFMANLFIDYIDAVLNDVLIFDVIRSKAPEFVGH